MDPTKNFDHLDPKLKETYARVMGTATGVPGTAVQNSVAQPATPAPQPTAPGTDQNYLNQPLASGTVNQQSGLPNQNIEPNPGTGPTVSSIPQETSTVIPAAMPQAQSAPDMNSPATSSFFSNPSPATTDPAQNPVPSGANPNVSAPFPPPANTGQVPVTPYSPDSQAAAAAPTEEMAQPLPSPATVAQKGPHDASALLRVLYIIGGVIFFAIYTVFWIKVFNLPFFF
jgi:hypothetical protein